MSVEETLKPPSTSRLRRATLAIIVFVGVMLIGFLGALYVGLALNHFVELALPHTVAENATRTFASFLSAALPMAAFLAGLVAALMIWDPKIAPRTEAVGLIIALLGVASTWAPQVLFSVTDTLFSVRALVVFELIGAALGISALVLVFRWNVDRPTLIGIKAITIFLVVGFFVLAPLALATNYFLVKLNVPLSLQPDGWAGLLGAFLSFSTAVVALGRTAEPAADAA